MERKKQMKFSLGTDTEIFAVDKKGNHRSLCGLVGGTKEHPEQMPGLDFGFAYQEDNVAVEFNIPPAYDRLSWGLYISTAKRALELKLGKELGMTFSRNCAVSFDKTELSHPNALVFGCEPDYNAWKLVENKKPTAKDPQLRTAGGHIHVGCNMDMVKGVQNMDLYLGVPSVILDNSKESVMRRELYGKHGAMRPKPYGWEYRVLSNFWVFDDNLINWVWNATAKALDFSHKFTKKEEKIITTCIDTGDVKKAEELVKHYGLIMP
jgi:hypothetical protein